MIFWLFLSQLVWAEPQFLKQIDESSQALKMAETQSQWKDSRHHPSRWLKTSKQKNRLCLELLKREKLSEAFLFLEELDSSPCKKELTKKLDAKHSHPFSSMEFHPSSAHTPGGSARPTQEVILNTEGGPLIVKGDTEFYEIVLTFDDGPSRTWTPRVLNILKKYKMKALFFVKGRNARAHPELVERIIDEGHVLGGHTQNHPDLVNLSHRGAVDEVVKGFETLLAITDQVAPYFRFPYGSRRKSVERWMQRRDMAEFFWAVDTKDWKIKDPDRLLTYAAQKLAEKKRGVILFHDIQPQTTYMLERFIVHLNQQNYQSLVYRPDQNLLKEDLMDNFLP